MRSEIGVRLLRDGYQSLSRLREAHGGADWYGGRLLGRRALVVRGEEGVRTFYDSSLVVRHGAIPAPLRLLLFGPGAVHGLDGEQHQARKQVHLGILDRPAVERLASEVADRLEAAARDWPRRETVRLYDELVEVYGGAVLAWAGIDADEAEARRTSHELAAVVDGFGLRGTPYPRAALARVRTQLWARRLVRDVRSGASRPRPETALARLAKTDLSDVVAATDLLNLLRPTVAVAYFGAYAAHALDAHPQWRRRLAAGSSDELRAFEHELRRWYPFVPLLTGRLIREVQHGDESFPAGSFIVLDVVGTDRDPRAWEHPDAFSPDRFVDREPTAYDYVPHGGGDPARGHRCPGEPLAVVILEHTARVLAGLDYELADRSREVPLRRIPSLAAGHMELRDVRAAHEQSTSGR